MKTKNITIIISGYLIISSLGIGIIIAQFFQNGNQYAEEEEIVFPFIVGVTSNPTSMDPLGAYDQASGNIILNALEGLYGFDYTTEEGIAIIPRIASDMGSWNEDRDTLTISLKRDVYFWDGTKLTAEDVVWNFNRINALSESGVNAHASLWLNEEENPILKSITAISKYKVEMVLTEFTIMWENLLPFYGASIIKPFEKGMETTLGLEEFTQLIGTGPFKYHFYEQNTTTTLIRNNRYHEGPAEVQKIEFQFYPNAAASTDGMLAHEIHLTNQFVGTEFDAGLIDPEVNVEIVKTNQVYFYHMNVQNTPWNVRKAMQFAFNYSNIPSFSLTLAAHNSPIPDGILGYNGNLAGLPFYDLDLARLYMLNSEDTNIQTKIAFYGIDEDTTDEEWIAIANSDNPIYKANFTHASSILYSHIANDAQLIGINLIDHPLDSTRTLDTWMSSEENILESQFVLSGLHPPFIDPVCSLEPLFSSTGSYNWNGLNNDTIDSNIEAIKILSGDEKLIMLDTVVSQVIVEQAAVMYIASPTELIAVNINEDEGVQGDWQGFYNNRGEFYIYLADFNYSRSPQIAWNSITPFIIGFGINLGLCTGLLIWVLKS